MSLASYKYRIFCRSPSLERFSTRLAARKKHLLLLCARARTRKTQRQQRKASVKECAFEQSARDDKKRAQKIKDSHRRRLAARFDSRRFRP